MKRNTSTKNWKRILFLTNLLIFSILFFIQIVSAATPWWNTSFEFRQEINISTSAGSTPTNYQIKLDFDNTTIGSNFNWSRNCNDIEIFDNQTKLSYWTQNCNSTTQQASLWVKIPTSFSTTQKTLHIYYGNLEVSSTSNGSATFDFFDDFSSDLSKWTKHKSPDKILIVDNYLQISGATTTSPYGHSVIGSSATYTDFLNGIIEGELYLDTNAIAEIGFRGNYTSNTGYKSRADARASEGVSHLRPPYNGWAFLGSCSATGGGITTHTWLPFSITVNSNTFTIITQGKTRTCTDSTYNTPGEISFHNHYGLYSRYDNIRVRKYFASNINVNFNTEESLGLLNFNFINPLELSVAYIFKDDVFNISVNVNCIKKSTPNNCGNLDFNLRYNNTPTTFDNISTSSTSPLWITSSTMSCSLIDGENCTIWWLLNGSGPADSSYLLDVFATSDDLFTLNQKSKENAKILITNKAIVSFNQSVYDFGSFLKNSGNKSKTLSIIANLGDSTNVTVMCESGNCSRFNNNWINGINLNDGDISPISFTCLDTQSGNFSAIFSVSSNENSLKSLINLNCNVEKIYGPLVPQLINPITNTTISVLQNNTFKINASVSCIGECGEIRAFAIYNSSINTWKNPLYLFRQNLSLTSLTNINKNYQALLKFNNSNIGNNFNWSNNCKDIIFYSKSIEIPFWVESCDNISETMDVWIKTNDIINSTGYDFIMYYSYINLSKSNAENVFDFFDDFSETSLNLSKWNPLFNQGWSLSGGELIGTNTNGILHSVFSFSAPIILETKTRMISSAAAGQMSLGFYSTTSNGIGIREFSGAPSRYYYRNNDVWSAAITFDSLYNYHYNKISIDSLNNVQIRIEDLSDGTLSTQSFTNNVDNEKIALGRNYDNLNLNQAYNQRWDWIRTRMYVANEPILSISNQESLHIISTNLNQIPLNTLNPQPQTCIISEDGSCNFEWLVNATGNINSSYNISVLFLSNYTFISSITTGNAKINIIHNKPPSINLLEPSNSSKIISNGLQSFKFYIEDDSVSLNCSLYLNGFLNKTDNCLSMTNITWNLTLQNAYYTWFINVTDQDNISIKSEIQNFYLIKNYSVRVVKNIASENIDMYKIRNTIYNLLNITNNIGILDFSEEKFNYGSFTPIYDWLNLTSGNYNGTILGWNLITAPLSINNINYSITKNTNTYHLLDEFIIGLD